MACDRVMDYIKHGDSAELLKELDEESIDMTITSPPYDGLRQYDGIVETWSFDKFKEIANELYRVTKKGGVIIWVVGDQTKNGSETGTSFRQALYFKDIGFNLHDTMLYHKINPIPLNHNRYEQAFEYMFVLSKGRPKTFNPIRVECANAGKVLKHATSPLDVNQASRTDRVLSVTKDTKIAQNIFSYGIGGGNTKGHPAAFPLQLAKDQIISWSNEGDIILDPFMGSGTTALACKELNRHYIGFELNEKYVEIANNRLSANY